MSVRTVRNTAHQVYRLNGEPRLNCPSCSLTQIALALAWVYPKMPRDVVAQAIAHHHGPDVVTPFLESVRQFHDEAAAAFSGKSL